MFGDGKIEVINQDGKLYINMWEMVSHLLNSLEQLENSSGHRSDVSETLFVIISTLTSLALHELGIDPVIAEISDTQSMLEVWESNS